MSRAMLFLSAVGWGIAVGIMATPQPGMDLSVWLRNVGLAGLVEVFGVLALAIGDVLEWRA